MHYSIPSYIRKFAEETDAKFGEVLDVGGGDVNGSSSKIWKSMGCTYYAADIESGPNIDYVISKDCSWNLGKQFDVVFSTSTIEHVDEPWILVPTMAKHVKPGGWLFIIAPWAWPIHRYPKDYWRFGPDGMEKLFKLAKIPVTKSGVSKELFWGWRAIHGIRPFISGLIGNHASHIDCFAWGQKPVQ